MARPVQSANPLFKHHWVPRKVKMKNYPCVLEILAYGKRVRTDKDGDLAFTQGRQHADRTSNFLRVLSPSLWCEAPDRFLACSRHAVNLDGRLLSLAGAHHEAN